MFFFFNNVWIIVYKEILLFSISYIFAKILSRETFTHSPNFLFTPCERITTCANIMIQSLNIWTDSNYARLFPWLYRSEAGEYKLNIVRLYIYITFIHCNKISLLKLTCGFCMGLRLKMELSFFQKSNIFRLFRFPSFFILWSNNEIFFFSKGISYFFTSFKRCHVNVNSLRTEIGNARLREWPSLENYILFVCMYVKMYVFSYITGYKRGFTIYFL